MCGILFSALILMVLVKVVASDDAEPEFWPMAGVVVIATLANLVGQLLLNELIGPFGGLAGIIVLVPALIYVCQISLKKAVLATVLYVVVQVVLVLGVAMIFSRA